MLTIVERVILLQKVDIFADIPTEELGYLASIGEEISYLKGEVLFRENDPSDALYLILDGAVRLHRGEVEIMIARSHDTLGAWALFDQEPRIATATVLDDSRLLRITHDDFLDLLSDHVQITRGILRTLAMRLRSIVGRVGLDSSIKAKA